MQTAHLNIAWLPSDSKIYLAKRAAAKRTAQVKILPLPRMYFKEDSQAIGDIRQVTVTLDADTFERLKPGAASKIRHIVGEAVRSEVNIR